MTSTILNEEKLDTYLIVNGFKVEEDVLAKAKLGDGFSLSKIADIYYDRKNYIRAFDWYRLDAANNMSYSQMRVGNMYHHGEGVFADYKVAMEWYLKAYDNGNVLAANYIGEIYCGELSVAKNYALGLKWHLEAANRGFSCAQNSVGVYYENGYGVDRDIYHALEWYIKSADQGYQLGIENRKRLNDNGYHIDDRQKKYDQMKRDAMEQKEKIDSLEKKLKISDEMLRSVEYENKILKQEIEALKLEMLIDKKQSLETNSNKNGTYKREEMVGKKLDIIKASDSTIDNDTQEDDPENDLYYD